MGKRVTKEEILQRFVVKHGDKYDYSKVNYVNSSTKVEIICPIHGSFFQNPSDHTKGCACIECGHVKTGATKRTPCDDFITRSKEKHGEKYDYSLTNYEHSLKKVKIVCPTHGEFEQNPFDHLYGKGCLRCSYEYRGDLLRDDTMSFLMKARRVHGDRYDYSKVEYVSHDKNIKIICRIHGEFEQPPNRHINGEAGCYECGRDACADKLRKPLEVFISDSKRVHGDIYNYSKVDYRSTHEKVIIGCKLHGDFTVLVGDHLHGPRGCPVCSAKQSKPERFIENILIKNNIEYQVNCRSVITPWELDFHIPSHNLAIEFHGFYFHSELTGGKDRNYHLNKTLLCEKKGIRLIQIFEDEYVNNPLLLQSKIENILGLTKHKIFARKCTVKEVSSPIKKKFVEKYHIQGDANSTINLGLYYKNKLVQIMTFSGRRKSLGATAQEGEYELCRMCSMKTFNVLGGASKLLKHFERNYNPQKLVSYADRRWSRGGVYDNLGFNHTHNSSPSYWYFLINNNRKRYHRYVFAKHTLSEKLENFKPELSEWVNMKNHQWDRIWDCGNYVFEKTYLL